MPLRSLFRIAMGEGDAAANPAEPLRGSVIVLRLEFGRIVEGSDMQRDFVNGGIIGWSKRRTHAWQKPCWAMGDDRR